VEIIVASSAGFCFGVKRAIRIARKTLSDAQARDGSACIYTLGPLVHNPRVVDQLRKTGIVPIEEIPTAAVDARGAPLIIRTHGIPPNVLDEVKDLGFSVIDATCPLVKKIHTVVSGLRSEGFRIAIIGHGDHPEVKGILGYGGSGASVVQTEEEARVFPRTEKLGAVVQTTFIDAHFRAISGILEGRTGEYRVFNTICQATTERQLSTSRLAERADILIVVGSRQSSNTLQLAETCAEKRADTYLVEHSGEVRSEWLKGAAVVGITAGASTPRDLIDEVCEAVRAAASI
jgi:4-hydroxy-3-methylbut-2-enyl diphosphate reductase